MPHELQPFQQINNPNIAKTSHQEDQEDSCCIKSGNILMCGN
jgi:hypothetical protein